MLRYYRKIYMEKPIDEARALLPPTALAKRTFKQQMERTSKVLAESGNAEGARQVRDLMDALYPAEKDQKAPNSNHSSSPTTISDPRNGREHESTTVAASRPR
jgi:hypothetical protein